MKLSFATVLVCALLTTCLRAQLGAPSPGFVRYAGLPIRCLYGVAGNFVPGPAAFGNGDAAAFSDTAALIVANNTIRLLTPNGTEIAQSAYTGATPLPGSGPGLTGALAWLPDTHVLLWFDGRKFHAIPFDDGALEARIESVSLLSSKVARLLTMHSGGEVSAITVSLPGGEVISSDLLPGILGPAYQFGSSVIWRDSEGLQIEKPDGSRHAFALPPGSFTAEQMSSSWVHIYLPSEGSHWALHLNDTAPSLSRVPALLPIDAKGNAR